MGEKASLSNHRFKRKKARLPSKNGFSTPSARLSKASPYPCITLAIAGSRSRRSANPTHVGEPKLKTENRPVRQPFATDPETRDVFHSARPLMGTALLRGLYFDHNGAGAPPAAFFVEPSCSIISDCTGEPSCLDAVLT